jgi:hypothetical protein
MAAGANQPVDLGRNLLEIDLAVFPERCCHRRYHAGWTYLHGESSLFVLAADYCPAFPGTLTGCTSLAKRAAANQRQE